MDGKIKKSAGWLIVILLALSIAVRTIPIMRMDIARGVGEFVGGFLVVWILYWWLIKEKKER